MIEKASKADAGLMVDFQNAQKDIKFSNCWSSALWLKTLNSPVEHVWILKSNKGVTKSYILAFMVIMETSDVFELLHLEVLFSKRRQGLAQQLLEYLIEFAKVERKKIWLELREDNGAAYKLYLKLGFVKVGCRPNYYRDPDNRKVAAVLMEYSVSV